jgi:maltose alpha-D-glucosyltransferase / alpha-amylase
MSKELYFEDDPLWYKDAVIYELHVRAFYDSNNDGIGDFKGLIQKLDYLEDLGITAIWLLPFYPSPLKDDGYDIADYWNIHKDYGTLRDFRNFLRAAHQRGIRVITELVLNHTSCDHKWFQKARSGSPGDKARDWYVWSDSAEKYKDARIIFQDFETSNWAWDSVSKSYYWHRFYSHQPDLNFDNPAVQKALLSAIDFWFDMGVDGLRLDAVPYLFEREDTNCENLPETHEFLKHLRTHIDKKFKNKMLLAEANQWPEDAAAYFGQGDECHMAFHFPVMPRIFMAIQMEEAFPIVDILKSTPKIPDMCQWATFLRNHDELTLEMVTDEERDYMYRLYAKDPRAKINVGIRRRLAPLLDNNRRKIELLNILLFSLPGTPVLYYGDEIGMGDNFYLGDRNGVRTPMQWSANKNAGFSNANPHRLYFPIIIDPEYHYEAVNVENQSSNLSSLLWWMKRIIDMRKQSKAFSRGELEIVASNNNKVLSFTRQYEDETVVVVINLSRFAQVVQLELSKYAGLAPKEMFSRNTFPLIKKKPYTITLGPHSHFWLLLYKKREVVLMEEDTTEKIPAINVTGTWEKVCEGKQKDHLEELILPSYLKKCRWFSSKAKTIQSVKIIEKASFSKYFPAYLLLLEASFTEGGSELYFLPISFMVKDNLNSLKEEFPSSIIAYLLIGDEEGALYDSMYSEGFRKAFFSVFINKKKVTGQAGDFIAFPNKALKQFLPELKEHLPSYPLGREQSNTSIVYDRKLILKFYRRIDEGINPEYEINKFVSEQSHFMNVPLYYGVIEYKRRKGEPFTIALLQQFIENAGDAWKYSQDVVTQYFNRILAKKDEGLRVPQKNLSILDIDNDDIPLEIKELIGDNYLEMVSLLGKRTAELHLSLASLSDRTEFKPEPFSLLYQRSIYQSFQGLVRKTIQALRNNIKAISKGLIKEARDVISSEQKILKHAQKILQKKISAMKIRVHGDYHLGQVIYTGNDFIIIDFEGEPLRALSERRLKHSSFKDVAGLIRSFHYAAYATLFLHPSVRSEDVELLEEWIEPWYKYTSGIFLQSYLKRVDDNSLIPKERDELEILLRVYILEKAVYELGYELNNRPDWIIIPLKAISNILKGAV